MGELAGTLAAAAGLFAGTNIDDIIVLTVLFLSARAGGVPRPGQIWTGAGVTIANGGDNIAVYTPMFRTIGLGDSLVTVAAFAVLVALWCAAGRWLGSHGGVVDLVRRFGRWVVPTVFILIGVFILAGSGLLPRLVATLW